jgi:hypothetical protein
MVGIPEPLLSKVVANGNESGPFGGVRDHFPGGWPYG